MSHRYLTWWNEIRWNSFLSEGKLQAYWYPHTHTNPRPQDNSYFSPPPVAQQRRVSRAWTVTWTGNDPTNHICSHRQCGRSKLCFFKGQITLRSGEHMSTAQDTKPHFKQIGRIFKQENGSVWLLVFVRVRSTHQLTSNHNEYSAL